MTFLKTEGESGDFADDKSSLFQQLICSRLLGNSFGVVEQCETLGEFGLDAMRHQKNVFWSRETYGALCELLN